MPERTIADVIMALERIVPFQKAASWDPVGLQLGDPASPVRRVAVCHEVTEAVVERVEGSPVDLLVAYHPLLFEPTTRLVAGRSAAGRAVRLIQAGVALAVVHTAFDVVPGGCADALAEALGLVDVEPFGLLATGSVAKVVVFVPSRHADAVTDAMAAAGAGMIGNYTSCSFRTAGTGTFLPGRGATPFVGAGDALHREPEERVEMIAPRSAVDGVVAALVRAHPYEEPAFDVIDVSANDGFIGRVGRLPADTSLAGTARLVADAVGGVQRVTPGSKDPVRLVAVVPGSGASYITAAARVADVMVTGDVGHHRAREASDAGLAVIDPGHAATERPGVARLYSAVAELGSTLDLTAIDSSPWEEPE